MLAHHHSYEKKNVSLDQLVAVFSDRIFSRKNSAIDQSLDFKTYFKRLSFMKGRQFNCFFPTYSTRVLEKWIRSWVALNAKN